MRYKLQALLLTLCCFFSLGLTAKAQTRPRIESASLELLNFVTNKADEIRRDFANFKENEWVGSYVTIDGPTSSSRLNWSPKSGFAVLWYNCSRPVDLVNYGQAAWENGSLKLASQLGQETPGSLQVAENLIPVKWGARHFLIESERLREFIYAVNSTSTLEIETFFLKDGDQTKSNKGLPDVPKDYRKYIGMKPLRARITAMGETVPGRCPRVTLDVGSAGGVIPSMTFYLARPRGIYLRAVVTGVEERSAEACVSMVTYRNRSDERPEPKTGWRLTSRAPADERSFWP